jgi:aryl-alcohol dehydrogenase-like predicted oxidoreductase
MTLPEGRRWWPSASSEAVARTSGGSGTPRAPNRAVYEGSVPVVADARGVEPAQIALAWVATQSDRLGIPVVPIPGTKRVRWLEQNAQAADITLTDRELAMLDPLAAQVVGARY